MIKEKSDDFLRENYFVEGHSEKELMDVLSEISENTITKKVKPSCFTIISLVKIRKSGFDVMILEPDYMDVESLFPLNPKADGYFSSERKHYVFQSFERLERTIPKPLIEEIKKEGYYLIYSENKDEETVMIPAHGFMATLCQHLGISRLPGAMNPLRDIYIGNLLSELNEGFLCIWREGKKVSKAFACLSPKFSPMKQVDAVSEILASLREKIACTVGYFKFDHQITTVRIDFSELTTVITLGEKKKRITPCVTFFLSDIGDASYTLQSGLCVNGMTVSVGEPYTRIHRGNVSIAALGNNYMHEFFPKLKAAMEKIANLPSLNKLPLADTILTILEMVNFPSACGINIAKMYYKNIKEEYAGKTGNSVELLLELLDTPGNLGKVYYETTRDKRIRQRMRGSKRKKEKVRIYSETSETETGKQLSREISMKVSKCIGSIFLNPKISKVIGWESCL